MEWVNVWPALGGTFAVVLGLMLLVETVIEYARSGARDV
jgi:hypothetical protein